jgi:hypothetical protein
MICELSTYFDVLTAGLPSFPGFTATVADEDFG